ncbi:hypothetical protein ASF32_12915 [Methylobacterium sp. Leaf91]|nr:hypothetical protein ASF32_12915 [Methylobacterium sp. Leaf91]
MDECSSYGFPKFVKSLKQASFVATVGDQRELFASKSPNSSNGAELALHNFGYDTKNLIADQMAVIIVH